MDVGLNAGSVAAPTCVHFFIIFYTPQPLCPPAPAPRLNRPMPGLPLLTLTLHAVAWQNDSGSEDDDGGGGASPSPGLADAMSIAMTAAAAARLARRSSPVGTEPKSEPKPSRREKGNSLPSFSLHAGSLALCDRRVLCCYLIFTASHWTLWHHDHEHSFCADVSGST